MTPHNCPEAVPLARQSWAMNSASFMDNYPLPIRIGLKGLDPENVRRLV
jgi:hypothetical protein